MNSFLCFVIICFSILLSSMVIYEYLKNKKSSSDKSKNSFLEFVFDIFASFGKVIISIFRFIFTLVTKLFKNIITYIKKRKADKQKSTAISVSKTN
jgi:uncharacterized membrane protein